MQQVRGDGRAPNLGPAGPRCPHGSGRRAARVLPATRACASSLDAGSQRATAGWAAHADSRGPRSHGGWLARAAWHHGSIHVWEPP
eukprot:7417217-Alexandrium_andersonii.AAC.1